MFTAFRGFSVLGGKFEHFFEASSNDKISSVLHRAKIVPGTRYWIRPQKPRARAK